MMKQLSALIGLLSTANAAYDSSPLVPMRDYKDNFRTLNGWECFEAQGKFCHDKDHKSMVRVTGSSNAGHGVCCKPDFDGEHCNSGGDHRCSQPVAKADTSAEYMGILTEGLNHQMFAFLPKTNPKLCGIGSATTEDVDGQMKISAGQAKQTISLIGDKALEYKDGRPEVRRYDACFYEINSAADDVDFQTDDQKKNLKIIVNLSKLKNMNVFVYEGKDRASATKPVNGNMQLVAGRNYTVPYTEGMVLIAYPNKDSETEFEFEYYVAQYSGGALGMVTIIAIAVVVAIFLICIVVACVIRKRQNRRIEIVDTEKGVDMSAVELTVEEQPSRAKAEHTEGEKDDYDSKPAMLIAEDNETLKPSK